jgi:hypothetical protein
MSDSLKFPYARRAPREAPATTPRLRNRIPKSPSRLRLLLPIALLGVVVALTVGIVKHQTKTVAVSDVIRNVRDLALQPSRPGEVRPGGRLGDWWIAADAGDPLTGELRNFQLQSGDLNLAAARAVLKVDPERDAVTFELFDVTYLSTPYIARGEDAPDTANYLHTMESFTLGPRRLGYDIVPDAQHAATTIDRSTSAAVQP